MNKTIPALWKLWDLELIREWDLIPVQQAEGLQMFMVDRFFTSMSLTILYSETGTIYQPLEVVLAIKFCALLIFRRERAPDAFIHFYS